ncbi:MAG: glycoside hydrolase family 1 protein [Candidatus Binatia bacterium]
MDAPLEFPAAFRWGAATAAHQIEGDCRNNHWWAWEQEGGHIADGSVSGAACDHWNRVIADADLVRSLGHNAHRLSIEWSRIEPTEGEIDHAALEHYRRELTVLRERGIAPSVTLHHFTNPLWMQRQGGWENPRSPEWAARYTERAVAALRGLVDVWWTINEPMVVAVAGYVSGMHPPCVRDPNRAVVVARHLLMAHARMAAAVRAADPGAPVGIVKHMPDFEPLDPDSAGDRGAAEAEDWFMNGCFLESLARGTVLPPFGDGEVVAGLAGSSDVIGLNYYSRVRASSLLEPGGLGARPRPGEQPEITDMGWEVHPEGLRRSLVRLAAYGRPLYVTENGIATTDDEARRRYLVRHLVAVHAAMSEGADVRGYFHWTLYDNFEWAEGYRPRFGLVAIDRATLQRRPRPSASLYREVISANAITPEIAARYDRGPTATEPVSG